MSYRHLYNFSRTFANWPTSPRPTALATKFCKDFNEFYPNLVEKTIENYKGLEQPLLKKYCKRILEYYTLCKLPVQGEFLVYAYELLEEPGKLTDEKLHQAYALASASEAIQCGWAIQDDRFDNCKTRAGKVSWHLLPDTSKMNVNDALLVRSFINEMIRQNIDKSIYPKIMDVVDEMYLETEMGQFYDNMLPLSKDLGKHTMQNYEQICELKASCYAFIVPLKLALLLSNKASEKSFQVVKHLCSDLGVFLQINNDFAEYQGFNESTPYIYSSDFENGTCTWTSVKALEKFNEEQKRIFEECYGSSDPEKIRRVINLYNDVDMKKLYEQEEAKRYDTYLQKVRELSADSIPSREVFMTILDFFQNYMSYTTKFYYEKN